MDLQLIRELVHDLRQPLSGLALARHLMAGDRRGASWPIRLEQIDRSTRRALELLDALESVLSAATITVDRRRGRISDAVADALAVHAPAAEREGVTLVAVCAPELDRRLSFDRVHIGRALSNLLSNAIKFSSRGGTVRVRARPVEGRALLSVEDTGRGIPASDLHRVLERGYEGHDRSRRGLGLGLPIARWIAEAHGGLLRVESEHRRGSIFTIELPLDVSDA